MPPGIAEAVELRLADAREVVDRDLAHGEAAAVGLEDHLGGELHPGRVEVERRKRVASDGAHPAVRVRDLHAEEDVEHPGEDRVADVAVQPRHGVAVDRSLEARADDEVVALFERVDEGASSSSGYVPSASPMTMYSPCAARARPGRRCRTAARLGDDSRRAPPRSRPSGRSTRCRRRSPRPFAPTAGCPRTPGRRPADRLLLVQARNDDRDLRVRDRHRQSTLAGRAVASASVTVSRRARARVHLEGRRPTRFARGMAEADERLALVADIAGSTRSRGEAGGSGHLGSSFSAMDIVVWLYSPRR